MIRIKSKRIIAPDGIIDGYLYFDNGRIVELSKDMKQADECYDFGQKNVSPGFIDMHTHGGGGHAFMNSTVDDVIGGANLHLKHGTTTIVPTISAGCFETMKVAVQNIDAAMKDERSNGTILGAHLEGPYLSAKQCGAQCPVFITEPIAGDYIPLVEEYGSSIVRWTYAPENDHKGEFCKYLTSNGIIASAGHSDAKYEDMAVAIDNGCNLITHLYSCTSTVTRDHGFRSLGVIESAFLRDELFVEIIADGRHLPPDLIKMIVKVKGSDRVALITDSLEIAATDVKEGVMSGTEFIVEEGVCRLKDRSAFAGSVATADRLIRVMVKDCGYEIPLAIKMMTQIPAKILGINKGELALGKDADIVVFDDDINIEKAFVAGREISFS